MLVFVCFLSLISSATAVVKNELNLIGDEKIGSVVKTQIKYLKASELPLFHDLRPKGLLSTDLNQHIPTYWLIYYIFIIFYADFFLIIVDHVGHMLLYLR
jgi:hypothetical protein